MKKLIFVMIAAMGVSLTSYAQMSDKEMKKAVTEARKIVKEAKKNIESETGNAFQAKKLIDGAMQNDLLKDWDQTWMTAAEIYSSIFKTEYNKSVMLGQRFDTLGMYTNLCKWIDFSIVADSLQQIPDAKGKTKSDVRKNFVQGIVTYSDNLFIGGVTYLQNNDFKNAFKLFDKYMSLENQEIFRDAMAQEENFTENRSRNAFYTAYSAYSNDDWNNCLKYALMVDDEKNAETAMQFICVSYEGLGDTVKWIESLKDGIVKFPTNTSFYDQLLGYYSGKNDNTALESFATEMIASNPDKATNYYILGFLAQQGKDYDKAIEQYNIALEKDETFTMAYDNICLCYMMKAADLENANTKVDPRSAAGKKLQAQVDDIVKQTIPYYEKWRTVKPDEVAKWGNGLYGVYYRLRMTKEFNEIEKLLQDNGLM